MKKWLYKILMLVAVATIVGHNSLPHHHHVFTQALAHHNDRHEHESSNAGNHEEEQSKEDHHNIFSFAQLDDDFLASQFSKTTIGLPVLYLLTSVITYHLAKLKKNTEALFGYYREFPPPVSFYSCNLFSRPPPVSFAA